MPRPDGRRSFQQGADKTLVGIRKDLPEVFRQPCPGLGRSADGTARIAAEEDRQQVTLRLRIAPDEYAALFRFAGEAHPTIRSRFRFRFAGGSSLFTLRAVEAYDPREGVAHCTFDRLCDD